MQWPQGVTILEIKGQNSSPYPMPKGIFFPNFQKKNAQIWQVNLLISSQKYRQIY